MITYYNILNHSWHTCSEIYNASRDSKGKDHEARLGRQGACATTCMEALNAQRQCKRCALAF